MGVHDVTASTYTLANDAYDASAWAHACELFRVSDETAPLGAEDLERWATAAYLAGRDDESTDALERAYRNRLDGGEAEHAVRCAFWVAFGLLQRGEMARGGGWLASAQRLLDERQLDCVGAGYLEAAAGLMGLHGGQLDEGRTRFERAGEIAARFGDDDLGALSRLGVGQVLWASGQAVAGARHFDEVMVTVTRAELSPVVAGIVYCAVVDGCQRALDVRRAYEWTAALSRWCDAQPELVAYRGQCLVHRSQVLLLHGDVPAAVEEARAAADRLADPPRPAIGMAHYQLGEAHRLCGDFAAAESAYLRAEEQGHTPQPGLALVRLAEGDVTAARSAIDTAVAAASDEVELVRLLPAHVEIMLASGDIDEAAEGADRLHRLADDTDSEYLDAVMAHARGRILLARGEARSALRPLRTARETWRQLEIPYEEGQARVTTARACRALGDDVTTRLECAAARRIFGQIGALPALRRIDELFASPVTDTDTDTDADADADADELSLTPREVQVLQRVADGHTNKQIGEELFISVKTVERHLSNIFVKLDTPNRAAATAKAADAGLL